MRSERRFFEAAVRRHHAAVYCAARAIVRTDADAADVAQQVFLHCWRGHVDLAGEPVLVERRLRWLAGRLALSNLRGERRRRRHELELAAMHRELEVSSSSSSGLAADELTAVRAAVDALPDDQRAAVVLRFHGGLTLAAIGAASGCAESTAHDRLQAAMAKLQHRLRELGFGVAASRLEGAIAEAVATATVPAGLAVQLLAIPASAALLLPAKVGAVALLGLVLTAVVLVTNTQEPRAPAVALHASAARGVDAGAESAVRTRADVPATQEPQPRTTRSAAPSGVPLPRGGATERYADAPTASISGSIAADTGEALADVEVVAYARALSSKGDSFTVAARTDAQGRYDLTLPIPDRAGIDWSLSLRRPDWLGTFAVSDLHLIAGDQRRGIDATMRRWAGDTAGTWTTAATVTDAAGRAIAKASIQVRRRLLTGAGEVRLVRECGAETDADGRLLLSGDHLGDKEILVVTFGQPFAPLGVHARIDTATPAPLQFALQPDTPLAVRTVDARTGAPIAKVLVAADRDGRSLAVGVSDENGDAVMRGLDREPVSLTGSAPPWSRFCVDGVRAGGDVVVLRLKRADDPTAIGLHGAELHGRIVDAVTGEPVTIEFGAVHSHWVAADSPATAASLLVEAITPHPFQTALAFDAPPPSADFHLALPQPGRYAVILSTPGRAIAAAGPFDVAEGQLVAGIELRAEIGASLEVVVRDAAGAAVEGAQVWFDGGGVEAAAARAEHARELAAASRRGQRASGGRGNVTDAEGRVVFEHLPTGISLCVQVADRIGRHGESGVAPVAASARREITVR